MKKTETGISEETKCRAKRGIEKWNASEREKERERDAERKMRVTEAG